MMTKRTKAILSLGGVFLIGTICGALAIGMFVRSEVRSAQRLRDRSGFQEYFADELELTRSQRDSLQEELDWFYGQLAGLRSAAAGEFHDLLDSLDARLVTHLSDDQVARLRTTERRLRQRIAEPRPAALAPVDASDDESATAPREPTSSVRQPSADSIASVDRMPPQRTGTPNHAGVADSSEENPRAPIADAADADPGEPIGRVGAKLAERLKLSQEQKASVGAIIVRTRQQIRADAAELRGYPRLQLEAARQRLQQMDREILSVLEPAQRELYEPVRAEIARKMRAHIMKQLKRRIDRHGKLRESR